MSAKYGGFQSKIVIFVTSIPLPEAPMGRGWADIQYMYQKVFNLILWNMKRLFLCSSFADVANLFVDCAKEDLQGKIIAFIPTASLTEPIRFYVKKGKKALEEAGMIVEEVEITQLPKEEISFADLERRITTTDRLRLESLCVISKSDNAKWLIDYWCGEDLKGLILMPFSEHWMAHIHACMLIRNKLHSK